jgi:hypothetical protein
MGPDDDAFAGWSGVRAHPDAPAGGGGPGQFCAPGPIMTEWLIAQGPVPHPHSPAGRNQAVKPDAKPDLKLGKSDVATGEYRAGEIQDALLTVFGEISPIKGDKNLDVPHYQLKAEEQYLRDYPDLYNEAKAIASTIVNRQQWVEAERAAYGKIDPRFREVKKAFDGFIRELNNDPRVRHLGQAEVAEKDRELGKIRNAYNNLEKEWKRARNYKSKAESYLLPAPDTKRPATLTHVVTAKAPDNSVQYEGFETGKQYYRNFQASNNSYEKIRNYIRWVISKKGLEAAVGSNPAPYSFLDFLPAEHAGWTRIHNTWFTNTVDAQRKKSDEANKLGPKEAKSFDELLAEFEDVFEDEEGSRAKILRILDSHKPHHNAKKK